MTEHNPDDDAEDQKPACALTGTGVGSDTRAGSLRGGSATGSERDEAQAASDRYLTDIGEGLKRGAAGEPARGEPRKGLTNTGHASDQSDGPGDNADAATG